MNQQFNVDQTSFALQSMQDSVQTVQAMKAAGKELKTAFKQPELNINSIENLQDDLADMMVGSTALTPALHSFLAVPEPGRDRHVSSSLTKAEQAWKVWVQELTCCM